MSTASSGLSQTCFIPWRSGGEANQHVAMLIELLISRIIYVGVELRARHPEHHVDAIVTGTARAFCSSQPDTASAWPVSS